MKFTSKETLTVRSFSYSFLIGGKRGSRMEEVIAYSGSSLDSLAGEKVPIQPLRASCFFHVTKRGTSQSIMVLGY